MATLGLAPLERREAGTEHARLPARKSRPSSAHALQNSFGSVGNLAIQRLVADPSQDRVGAFALQRKLKVGSVDDPLEREADRVAEAVMRDPAPQPTAGHGAAQVQRKCSCGGSCENCREDEESLKLRRKQAVRPQMAAAASSAGTATSDAPASVHAVLRSPGQPLSSSVRTFFEPRFGADFSQVRVHTDAAAQQSARDVNAEAYTAGRNVVFGGGRFEPETPEGRRLLAHELTHVVQQSGGSSSVQPFVQRQACSSILNAEEVPGVTRGRDVEREVRIELISQLGAQNVIPSLPIPGASARLYRMEDCGGFQSTQPGQQGYPDLAFRQYPRGRTLELAEVKIGTWPCLLLAEQQLDNYVALADQDEDFKEQLGVDHVEAMPTSRFTPPQLITPDGTLVRVGWCSPGIIVYKAVADNDEEPEDREPKDRDPSPQDDLPEKLMELGKDLAKLLVADGLLGLGLRFAASLAMALSPFLALAALALGIVYFWDEIKSVARALAGAVKWAWDKITAVVGTILNAIKRLGIQLGRLAVWLGGLIKGLVEKIAEGLMWVGRRMLAGAKWIGGKIASAAEAVWDWLFGSDVEPIIPDIDLPITEEPVKHCGTVAREDALIRIESDLLFPLNEWQLKDDADAHLADAAAKVRATALVSDDPIRFLGYTDIAGSVEYNQSLSEKRAAAVADWFVEHNVIPKSKVKIDGFGETQAQAQLNDLEGRKKDRRVDILVKKKGSSETVCW